MNKAEREHVVAEAIAWILDGEPKFPGWDPDPKVLQSLFEASLIAYPNLQVLPALGKFRLRWLVEKPVPAKIWISRWRRWLEVGLRIGDPFVV